MPQTLTAIPAIPAVATYTISGEIKDNDTNSGIAGATVQLIKGNTNIGSSVLTAADGSYTITNVTPDTYNIEVSANSYVSGTISNVVVTSANVTGQNLMLHAVSQPTTYQVTFNTNGGSTVASIDATYDTTITVPSTPTKANHTFAGWYKDSELTEAWTFATDKVNGDITLYAKWTPATYQVTFNTNGGSTVASVDATYDTLITEPSTPTKANYTFAGWYKDSALTEAWIFAIDKVSADITLYAKWTATTPAPINNNPGSSYEPTSGVNVPMRAGQSFRDGSVQGILLKAEKEDMKQDHSLNWLKVTSGETLVQTNDGLISSVYSFNATPALTTDEKLTLVFTFDKTNIKSNQEVVVRYYNETTKMWEDVVGSQLTGNEIEINTNRNGQYAVFVKDKASSEEVGAPSTQTNATDISGHWAEENIKQAMQNGMIKGYPDGEFRPNAPVTRAEFATMLVNSLKLNGEKKNIAFKDVDKIGAWASEAVTLVSQEGLMNGYPDGSFQPQKSISRAELAASHRRSRIGRRE